MELIVRDDVNEPNIYLSNIKALNGLSAVSLGGGIRLTIASRISIIPIPSCNRKRMPTLMFSMRYRLMSCLHKRENDYAKNKKLTLAEQRMALLQSNPITYMKNA